MPEKPRELHDWNSVVPLSHLLMMSARPRAYASSIFAAKVAIVGDREAGVRRFLAFLAALEASNAMPEDFVAEARTAARSLGRDGARGQFLLLEPGELFVASAKPPVEQCAQIVEKQIPKLAAQVDELLTRPPEKLFAKPPRWLAQIKSDWHKADLGLGVWSSTIHTPQDPSPVDADPGDADAGDAGDAGDADSEA